MNELGVQFSQVIIHKSVGKSSFYFASYNCADLITDTYLSTNAE